MNLKKYLFAFSIPFLLLGCSSEETNNSNGIVTTHVPLTLGNYWTYDVETLFNDEVTSSRDSLYIDGEFNLSGKVYKRMETLAMPNGFYSNTLRNNGLRVDGPSVKLSGTVSYDLGIGTPLSFAVNDFIILKENASSNEQLSSLNGTFSQTVSGYDLDFTYNLKSFNVAQLSTFTAPNGAVYENVIRTKVVLNLNITTTQVLVPGFPPITITVLAPQDVLTSFQYYAKDIGMVYTQTSITYQLQSIPNVTIPFPSSGSQSQEEFLDTYQIN